MIRSGLRVSTEPRGDTVRAKSHDAEVVQVVVLVLHAVVVSQDIQSDLTNPALVSGRESTGDTVRAEGHQSIGLVLVHLL